jgi:hypothetical protein
MRVSATCKRVKPFHGVNGLGNGLTLYLACICWAALFFGVVTFDYSIFATVRLRDYGRKDASCIE